MNKISKIAASIIILCLLSACGSTSSEKALTGGLMGAGIGAPVGVICGSPVGGAIVGGVLGASIGALSDW